MPAMLEAAGLSKSFNGQMAVDDISLAVEKGEILGFLGPNGAGKTTTMKMLTGFMRPSSGSAKVCGELITGGNAHTRRHIGYLPEGAPLYGDMTPRAFLSFIARCHKMHGKRGAEAQERAVEAVDLKAVLDQRIATLSKGFRRRVAIAAAIIHAPPVLILDEPTDGLDPNQKHEVRYLIRRMSAERAIIISTHILEEVESLCSRAVVIRRGKIVADETPSGLKAKSKYLNAVNMLVPSHEASDIAIGLKRLERVASVEMASEGGQMRLTVVPAGQVVIANRVAELAASKGWTVSQFAVEGGRLEDVFRKLTSASGKGDSG